MNIGFADIATTTGLAVMKNGIITASSFKAKVEKEPYHEGERAKNATVESVFGTESDKAIDAVYEGKIGRAFEDYLEMWLRVNAIGRLGIEAPLPSNPTRTKTEIDLEADFAGKAVRKIKVAGASLASIYRIYGLSFIAVSVCARLNIPSILINQGTWRREFLGEGRPKDPKAAAKAMCKKLGIEIPNADAAEAAGGCWYLNVLLNPYATRRGDDLFAKATSAAAAPSPG